MTDLHSAAKSGDIQACITYIQKGFDVDTLDENGGLVIRDDTS